MTSRLGRAGHTTPSSGKASFPVLGAADSDGARSAIAAEASKSKHISRPAKCSASFIGLGGRDRYKDVCQALDNAGTHVTLGCMIGGNVCLFFFFVFCFFCCVGFVWFGSFFF